MNELNTNTYNWSDKTILIIENNETCSFLLKEYFKVTGIEILHARFGLDAINICTHDNIKIDVIIMNLGLPDEDGLNVARAIKAFRNIPIIAYSVIPTMEYKQTWLESRLEAYMQMPVDLELAAKIIQNQLFTELHMEEKNNSESTQW